LFDAELLLDFERDSLRVTNPALTDIVVIYFRTINSFLAFMWEQLGKYGTFLVQFCLPVVERLPALEFIFKRRMKNDFQ
jgi:hypothetical protein